MGKTIAFCTLGCKVNQADTAAMEEIFRRRGYTLVGLEEGADIYVVNTCVVTNTGQRKSRQMINRYIRRNPDAFIVVTGCYPQSAEEEVRAIPGVDLIIGNQERGRIVDLVEEAQRGARTDTISSVRRLEAGTRFEELAGGNEEGKTRAYLKIQEGCNQFCSYCIIPYARGPLRSRSLAGITDEVRRLVAAGYREVVLIGIHLGCYGRDMRNGTTLADAVQAALEVSELERLRLGSLESVEVDDRLLALMQNDKRLCPHLHLPLQSGCDKVLAAMRRPYDTAKFFALLEHIRKLAPNVAITTDVIVGFPGETEEDFAATCSFAERCAFAKIHIFPYSQRKGTPAAVMRGQIPQREKEARVDALEMIDKRLHAAYLAKQTGRTLFVLIEETVKAEREREIMGQLQAQEENEAEPQKLVEGLSENYLRVMLPGKADMCGKLVAVKILRAVGGALYGERV